jgi:hypothetical protein
VRRLPLFLLISLVVLTAPAAHAQGTTPAPPVAAKIKVDLEKVGHASRAVVFTGHSFRVRGVVAPYVAGQVVQVRFYRGSSLAHAATVRIAAPASGTGGTFLVNYRPKVGGRIRIGVRHIPTPEMAFAHARTPAIEVIGHGAALGDHNRTVRVMQELLRSSGYVVGRLGSYDARTARAVLAFRKMSSLPRYDFASYKVLRRIVAGGGQFKVRFPHQGRHAEGDLTHQVLALVNGSRVERLYPISSGKPSTPTVLGTFRIYLRTPGYLPDGMYYSSFFTGGYAIHGYDPAPTYPASHGCMRAPIPDAVSIYSWLAMGDYVDTYYRSGHHRHPKPSPNAGP